MVKYLVTVEGRTFEIEVGPNNQVWVNRQPLNVDLEGINGLPQYSLLVDHRSYEAHVEEDEDGTCQVVVAGRSYQASLQPEQQCATEETYPCQASDRSKVSAPLPGLLVEMRVVEGEKVREGDVIAVLESMKMNLELRAPRSGIVECVHSTPGAEVCQGEILATIGG